MNENELSHIAIGACLNIHKKLGPGLLESVYEKLLAYELNRKGIHFKRQVAVPVIYGNLKIDLGFRADFIVEDLLILELESIDQILPVHRMQLLLI